MAISVLGIPAIEILPNSTIAIPIQDPLTLPQWVPVDTAVLVKLYDTPPPATPTMAERSFWS